jgi:LmbE family N-acetylglucosaminyl deacetylase
MLGFSLEALARPIERVLAIGCHADDIEIGCGGTLILLSRARPGLDLTWVVLAASGDRAGEARASARAFLADAEMSDVRIHEFRDGFLPYGGGEVKEVFEDLKDVRPDLVFTHTRHDLHQDHRLACELTWNTFRDHLILEYEIPKYDGDLGTPNFYVPLEETVVRRKIEHLMRAFPSQAANAWFSEDTFRAVLRLRGIECNAESGLAEAFYGRKVALR